MKAGGRRGNRAAGAGEHGLVAFAIVDAVAAFDVRRQRHVSDRIDRFVHGGSVLGPEPDDAAPKESPLEDLAVQSTHSFKHHPRARFQFLPRVHQRLPIVVRVCSVAGSMTPDSDSDQQALDGAAAGDATAEQARWENARVVDHEHVAGAKQIGQRADRGMRHGSGDAIEVQQPRGAAIRGRLLRDQFGGKVEVELADVHPRVMLVDDSRYAPAPCLVPLVHEDGPQTLVEILAVAQERSPQHAFMHRADLSQRGVAPAILTAARASSRVRRSLQTRSRASAVRRPRTCPVPQKSEAIAKPHSAVAKSGLERADLKQPDSRIGVARDDGEADMLACRALAVRATR